MNVLAWVTIAFFALTVFSREEHYRGLITLTALLGLALAIWVVAT